MEDCRLTIGLINACCVIYVVITLHSTTQFHTDTANCIKCQGKGRSINKKNLSVRVAQQLCDYGGEFIETNEDNGQSGRRARIAQVVMATAVPSVIVTICQHIHAAE